MSNSSKTSSCCNSEAEDDYNDVLSKCPCLGFENLSFNMSNHSQFLVQKLNDLRADSQYCDVMIIASGVSFPAHKFVLSTFSPYFEAMFSGLFEDSGKKEITLQNVDAKSFQMVLEYMYTGIVNITLENFQILLSTSCFLQIDWLQEKCCEFMKCNLEPHNCVGIKNLADRFSLNNLKSLSKKFITDNFYLVSNEDEFLAIEFEELMDILTCNNIHGREEMVIFEGIMKWMNYDLTNRLKFLPKLLQLINPLAIDKESIQKYEVFNKDSYCDEWFSKVLTNNETKEWNIIIIDRMGCNSELFSYGFESKNFIQLKHYPKPLIFAPSVVSNKYSLYVQGGAYKQQSTRDSFRYDIYRNDWYNIPNLLKSRYNHRSVILGNILYAIGGVGINGTLSSVEQLDLTTEKQIILNETAIFKRSSMGAVTYENCIYIMGGECKSSSLYSVERYDPREGVWTELASMNKINGYCSSTILSDTICCAEGIASSMECYDFKADQWHLVDFFQQREFFELFTLENELYNLEGSGINRYCALDNEWLPVIEFPHEHDWDTVVKIRM